MKTARCKTGLTLVELLIAVAVVVILISITIVAGNSLRAQAEERLAAGTISILVTALEQYYEFHDEFPPDCAGCDSVTLAETLGGTSISGGVYHPAFASSSALYYYLSRTPNSREILDSISESLITAEGPAGFGPLVLRTSLGEEVTLLRVIDPWVDPDPVTNPEPKLLQKYLRYSYEEGWNFPRITSAGLDGKFGTADDITSKGM